jgi:thiol-disulfide isomerase/thioredoxin
MIHRSRRAALALLLLAAAACGGAAPPSGAKTTVISFKNLDCSDCGDQVSGDLAKMEGVYSAKFDKVKAEMTVVAAPTFDALAAAKKAKHDDEVFDLLLGAGQGSYLPWKEAPPGADVKTIVEGGVDVPDLTPHLVPGKVTIMDFGAKWCEPCRLLDEHLVAVMRDRQDIAYRKLDVGDWDTPLGTRYLKGVPALPYVIIFDKKGAKVDAIAGFDAKKVDAAIAKASAAP